MANRVRPHALADVRWTLARGLVPRLAEAAFAARNLTPPERERTLSVVGLSLGLAIERLAPSMDAVAIAQLAEDYKAAFAELRRDPEQREPLYPGVRELLMHLGTLQNVMLGVATGKSRRGVAAVLAREELSHLFHTIQTADTHPSKPDPSMLVTAMEEANAEPRDTVMIGDTTFDMDMATSAGVRSIGVSWGYHSPQELAATGAHTIVHDSAALLAELQTFIDGKHVGS